MKRLAGLRPSPSMVVAVIALCVALGGGAYAATKIGSKQLQKGAVKTSKLVKKERSEGFVFFDGSETALPGGTLTTVAGLTLPKNGSYFVTAQVGIDANSPDEETVECHILDDDTAISRAISALANDGTAYRGTVTMTGPVNGGSISLACAPDNASTARHRMITAIRIGTQFGG